MHLASERHFYLTTKYAARRSRNQKSSKGNQETRNSFLKTPGLLASLFNFTFKMRLIVLNCLHVKTTSNRPNIRGPGPKVGGYCHRSGINSAPPRPCCCPPGSVPAWKRRPHFWAWGGRPFPGSRLSFAPNAPANPCLARFGEDAVTPCFRSPKRRNLFPVGSPRPKRAS